MRTGPRTALVCLLLSLGLAAPAHAQSTLNVFVDNNKVALGAVTTVGSWATLDPTFGGGHITYEYQRAAMPCAATPEADKGVAITPDSAVAAGEANANVGGQTITLTGGDWVVCGWLIDDATGTVVASGQAKVSVVAYAASIAIGLDQSSQALDVLLRFSSSAPARLFLSLQRASKPCAKKPGEGLQILARKGKPVASDGGLGRTVNLRALAPGKWRVCSWLRSDAGSYGPATRTFVVPKRGAGRAAG